MTIRRADFWKFSLAVYREAPVQQECLTLQDHHGLDVNLVLFCAFVGAALGVMLSDPALKEAATTVEAWQREVVSQLRATRRTLKPLLSASPLSETPIATVRNRVKALELEAERIEQLVLERWIAAQFDSWPRSPPFEAIVGNMNTLFALVLKGQEPPPLPQQLIARALTIAGESKLGADNDKPADLRTEHHLWVKLNTCATFIERELERYFQKEFNFTPPRFEALAQLEKAPDGLALGELSRLMEVTPASITAIIRRLVKVGYVERKTHGTDRRIQIVVLTNTGKNAFRRMATRYGVWLDTLFECCGPTKMVELIERLDCLKSDLESAGFDVSSS
jgi:uncharacterized protein (TIGR02444 family)